MKLILAILFAAFAVSAAITLFLQIKYGHLTGPNSESAALGKDSPMAKKCHRQAMISATLAGIFLVSACIVGASIRS